MKKIVIAAMALFFLTATSGLVLAQDTATPVATPAAKATPVKKAVKKVKKAKKAVAVATPVAAAPAVVTPASK